METIWIYFINPFEVSTRKSYLKAMKMSTFHMDALLSKAGNPFFDFLIAFYSPKHINYETAFNVWNGQKGTQSGQTLGLKQQLKVLANTKINEWDVAIQAVYSNKTSEYKALLSHHHIPFQRGSQQTRINAVNTFNLALTGITALASLKTDVDNFATLLNDAYNLQKLSKASTTTKSKKVEEARKIMSAAMFSNYGSMITYFSFTPSKCAPYFDLENIRSASQFDFTGHLKPGKLHVICRRTFEATDTLEIINESDTCLNIYLGYTKTTTVPEDAFSIPANSHLTIKGEKLGNLKNKYLIISNPHASIKAAWKVNME